MHIQQHYVKHTAEASVIDFLILQSFLDPKGFLHAELGDKATTATLQEWQHIPIRHTHSSSQPKTASDHQKHLPEPNHHTPAEHTLTHTHLQNNEEKHKNHSCVRRQKRL